MYCPVHATVKYGSYMTAYKCLQACKHYIRGHSKETKFFESKAEREEKWGNELIKVRLILILIFID